MTFARVSSTYPRGKRSFSIQPFCTQNLLTFWSPPNAPLGSAAIREQNAVKVVINNLLPPLGILFLSLSTQVAKVQSVTLAAAAAAFQISYAPTHGPVEEESSVTVAKVIPNSYSLPLTAVGAGWSLVPRCHPHLRAPNAKAKEIK